jgi:hypothetical protein
MDPSKHDIWGVIYSRGLVPLGKTFVTFSFELSINKRSIYTHSSQIDEDFTKYFSYSMQGSGGNGQEESIVQDKALIYPKNINLVELTPIIPIENAGPIAENRKGRSVTIQGYIMVKRRKTLDDILRTQDDVPK